MKMPSLAALALIATGFCVTGAVAQDTTAPEAPEATTIAPQGDAATGAPAEAPQDDEAGQGAQSGSGDVAIPGSTEAPVNETQVIPSNDGSAVTSPADGDAAAPDEEQQNEALPGTGEAPEEIATPPVEDDGNAAAPAEAEAGADGAEENVRRSKEEPGPALEDGTDLSTMPADSADINAGNPDTEPTDVTPAAARTAAEIFGELPIIGQPQYGGIGFQPAATSLAAELHWLDAYLLVIITVIAVFVTGLLGWVIFRYNRRSNLVPARFTHNSPLEVTWTIVPILILVSIGAFSLPVLFDQQRIPEGDVVVKVTGYQWFWNYEYPEEEGVEFASYMIGADTSNMLTEDSLAQLQAAGYTEDQFRLGTDTSVVVPVDATVVMQVTGGDVIHSWTIPAFGVKQDGIPGRLAQLWFRAEQEGIYFGQCSELCGIAHAYMPITVKVVSQEAYAEWLDAVRNGELETW